LLSAQHFVSSVASAVAAMPNLEAVKNQRPAHFAAAAVGATFALSISTPTRQPLIQDLACNACQHRSPSDRVVGFVYLAKRQLPRGRQLSGGCHLAAVRPKRGFAQRLDPSLKMRRLRFGAPLVAASGVGLAFVVLRRLCCDGLFLLISAAVLLQSTSVATAAQVAVKGTHVTLRKTLLWLHMVLSLVSLLFVAAAAAKLGAGLSAQIAAGFTVWAILNGFVSFLDPRWYPALLQRFLTWAYGSVPRGKSKVMAYHRTVGALAYSFTTEAVFVAMWRVCPTNAKVPIAIAAFLVGIAAAALLLPSASRARFPLPQVTFSGKLGLRIDI